jgi:hypothetical protein
MMLKSVYNKLVIGRVVVVIIIIISAIHGGS